MRIEKWTILSGTCIISGEWVYDDPRDCDENGVPLKGLALREARAEERRQLRDERHQLENQR